eukprot:TRINITY_DN13760_c0_g1_i1.p1 TRINITY_DN13760_c0_g1~~TRINITY_DN13760_c0_g1_i1.p1  ORF type:complete len:622 (+),score=168.24 TRINITY_DN13760_c0_g1_i1:57-1868(+)
MAAVHPSQKRPPATTTRVQRRQLQEVRYALETLVGEISQLRDDLSAGVQPVAPVRSFGRLGVTLPVGAAAPSAYRAVGLLLAAAPQCNRLLREAARAADADRPRTQPPQAGQTPVGWAAGKRIAVPAQTVTLEAPTMLGYWRTRADDGTVRYLDPVLARGVHPPRCASPISEPTRETSGDSFAVAVTTVDHSTAPGSAPELSLRSRSIGLEPAAPERDSIRHVLSEMVSETALEPTLLVTQGTAASSASDVQMQLSGSRQATTAVATGFLRRPEPQGCSRSATPATSPALSQPATPLWSRVQTGQPQTELHISPRGLSPVEGGSSHGRRKVRMSPLSLGGDGPGGMTIADYLESPHRLGPGMGVPLSLRQLPSALSDGVASSAPPSPHRMLMMLLQTPDESELYWSDNSMGPGGREVTGQGGSLRSMGRPACNDEGQLLCGASHALTVLPPSSYDTLVECLACRETSPASPGFLECRRCRTSLCRLCAMLRVPLGVQLVHRAFDGNSNGVWYYEDAQRCEQCTDGSELRLEDWQAWCSAYGGSAEHGVLPCHLTQSYRDRNAGSDLLRDVRTALRYRPDLSAGLPQALLRGLGHCDSERSIQT